MRTLVGQIFEGTDILWISSYATIKLRTFSTEKLTYLRPIILFYTHWKHQNGFRGHKKTTLTWNGLNKTLKSNKKNFGFFIWGYFTLHVNKIKQNKLDVHQVLNNIGVPGVCQKVQKKMS